MKIRQLSIVGAVLVLVLGFIGFKNLKNMATPPARENAVEAARLVPVEQVNNGDNEIKIAITGRLQATDKIELFAEVNGKFLNAAHPFKSGVQFKQGEVLVRLDDEETRLTVLSEKSNLLNLLVTILPDLKLDYPAHFSKWEAYVNEFDFKSNLTALPDFSDAKLKRFITARGVLQAYFRIQSLESRLEKYTLIAPFTGVLAATTVQEGALVRANQKLGEFFAVNTYELMAAVNKSEEDKVRIGDDVQLTAEADRKTYMGKIIRKSKRINPQTQTVDVYISLQGEDLFEGQFLSGSINGGQMDSTFVVARKLLDEQNRLFAVEDSTLQFLTVSVQHLSENEAIVKGLPQGATILTERLNGIYPGQKVSPYQAQL